MLTVGLLSLGAVGGFIFRTRRHRRQRGIGGLFSRKKPGVAATAASKVKGILGGNADGEGGAGGSHNEGVKTPRQAVAQTLRRAFASSVLLFRVQTMAAFKRTAKHYAPVPLTYAAAMATSGIFVFGTTFFINVVLFSGFNVVSRHARTWKQSAKEAKAAAKKDNGRELEVHGANITTASCALGGYIFCLIAWEKSALRGSLTVFGKDPHLDRCAGAERYLVEKLALLATAGYKATAKLGQLQRAGKGNVAADAAVPLSSYASQIANVGNFFGINDSFAEFTERYVETNRELNGMASKLKYPGQMSRLEPSMDKASMVLLAPLRGKQAACDVASKLNELRRELGVQLHITTAVLLPMTFGAGWLLGMELARVPWLKKKANQLHLA